MVSVEMSKSVLIDGHNLALPSGTGIATYTRHLAKAVRQLGYATDVLVDIERFVGKSIDEVAFYDALTRRERSFLLRWWLEWQWATGAPFGIRPVAVEGTHGLVDPGVNQFSGFDRVLVGTSLFDIARYHFMRYGRSLELKLEREPDLFHVTHPSPMKVPGRPTICTIHDIVPIRLPNATLDNKVYFRKLIEHLCQNADHIVTVSDFSRQDIIRLTGIPEGRITNTYQAVTLPDKHMKMPDAEVAEKLERAYQLAFGEYFLFVGAIEPKKNLERLIDAYAGCGSNCPLVLVGGRGWQNEDILSRLGDEQFLRYIIRDNEISIHRKVRRLSYVPISRLVMLLRGARAVLFPSIYEGFGLPVVEAMLAGAPVITSNTTSLAEVAGDAALQVDAYDVDALCQAIVRIDSDADLRRELSKRGRQRAAKFSPENHQERLAEVYKRVLTRSG